MKKKEASSYEWERFYSIRDFNNTDFWKTKSAAKPWIEKGVMSKPYPSGIYVYGFIEKINGKNLFAPYYVGKSGTVVIGIGTTWPGAFEIQFDEPYNIWTYPILEYLTLQREEKLKELGIV